MPGGITIRKSKFGPAWFEVVENDEDGDTRTKWKGESIIEAIEKLHKYESKYWGDRDYAIMICNDEGIFTAVGGLLETYKSETNKNKRRNGQKFKLIEAITKPTKKYHKEKLPVFTIEFQDGKRIEALSGEIFNVYSYC